MTGSAVISRHPRWLQFSQKQVSQILFLTNYTSNKKDTANDLTEPNRT